MKSAGRVATLFITLMAEKRQIPVHSTDQTEARGRIPPQAPENALPVPVRRSAPVRESDSGVVEGVYIISVAARLLEMHPQTLRKYERVGLVRPTRTMGMLRLYSERDMTRLRLIKYLVDDAGMNLAGVEFVLGLFSRLMEAGKVLATVEQDTNLPASTKRKLEYVRELIDLMPEKP